MRKIRVFAILTLALVIALPARALACTSFAVYSDKTLYGMNFDYPETELRLKFLRGDDMNRLYLEFREGDLYYTTAGVNGKGLFLAIQIQSPSLPPQETLGADEIYIGELSGAIDQYGTVDEVRHYLENIRLAPMQVPVHIMVADKSGDSMIVEAGENQNDLVISDRKFNVMTNFKNSDFAGQPYDKVTGTGADRYKTAYRMIQDHFVSFDIAYGWQVLKNTVQNAGPYPTLCSMLYDPENNTILLVLERNFERIWKVSLDEGKLLTYIGFDTEYEIGIGEEGITSSELIAGQFDSITAADPSAEAGDGRNSPAKIVMSLLLITLVLVCMSIVPMMMVNRAMEVKKALVEGNGKGDKADEPKE